MSDSFRFGALSDRLREVADGVQKRLSTEEKLKLINGLTSIDELHEKYGAEGASVLILLGAAAILSALNEIAEGFKK